MNWALWGLALVVDILGLSYALLLFTSMPDAESVAWGVLVLAIFTALLLVLIRPQLFGSHATVSARALSVAVPVVAFLGSLDYGSISGLEVVAVVIAGLVGCLNWVAFRRHPKYVAPRAA
jgi:hypothetical protein